MMLYRKTLSLNQQVLHRMMMFAGGLLGGGGDGDFLRQSPYTAQDGLQFLILLLKPLESWNDSRFQHTPLEAGSDLTTLALFVNTLPEMVSSKHLFAQSRSHTGMCLHNDLFAQSQPTATFHPEQALTDEEHVLHFCTQAAWLAYSAQPRPSRFSSPLTQSAVPQVSSWHSGF